MIHSAQVGAALHRAARIAAPAIALLITSAMLLGRLAYQLGYQLGSAIHARNAQLAALHVRILRLDTDPSQVRDSRQPIAINAAVLLREAGLSQRKIAASLGCSRSTVRRQLALASS